MFVKGSTLLSLEDAKSEIVGPSHSILVPITFHVCAIEPIKLAFVVVSLELSPVLINLGDCRRTSDSDYCSRRATRNVDVLRIVKTSNTLGGGALHSNLHRISLATRSVERHKGLDGSMRTALTE